MPPDRRPDRCQRLRRWHRRPAADLPPDKALEQQLGHVYVSGEPVLVAVSTAGRVFLYDFDGNPTGDVGIKGTAPCQTAFPVAAALDTDGKVIGLDKQRALFMRWHPRERCFLAEYSGFGDSPGDVYQPAGLALDPVGNVYISQGFEGRVQVWGRRHRPRRRTSQ